ncbi:serine-threonine kinase receptor-associated protein [Drosophila ficusphila]|uniref:serine-threonine kinase receptor-associated protein n=1 Tax=Drosophila ficusphila TaxID=30025 RepID=UPI0007E68B9E|nr:serine-threonine kinase receptor-associated protein [Drosophila ficusphila]
MSDVVCEGHTDAVVELSFSRDRGSGSYLASAGLDGLAVLRHGATGDWIGALRKHEAEVWSVSLSEDAGILASGGGDCKARIWDAVLGRQLTRLSHPETVACVDLDARGRHLVTGCLGRDPTISLFDLERPDKKEKKEQTALVVMRGHQRGVRDVTFCLGERCVLSSSYDRTVQLWDCLSGQRSHSVVLPHHAKSLELHPDGETVTIAYGESLLFLDCRRFEVLRQRKLPFKVTSASLHPGKECYACGDGRGHVHKFDFATDALLDSFDCGGGSGGGEVCSLRFSPDGDVCAFARSNGTTVLWRHNLPRQSGPWSSESSWDEDVELEEDESIS